MKALMKKVNRKGFTLAELLIVVAIIGVLVAISIPVFTAQLEKSREATDLANVRTAYAAVVTQYLGDGSAHEATVEAKQTQANWQTANNSTATKLTGFNEEGSYDITVNAITTPDAWTISVNGSGSIVVNND